MDRNEILFEYTRDDDHEPFEVVVRIDGTELTELIDEFEVRAGTQPAGDAYGGLEAVAALDATVESLRE